MESRQGKGDHPEACTCGGCRARAERWARAKAGLLRTFRGGPPVRPDELAGLSNLETSAVMAAALADVFGVKRDAPRGDPKCETCAGCGYHLPHPGMREACPDCVKREGA